MQRIDGRIVLSASDLNDFLACEYLTGLELGTLEGALERPSAKPAQAEVLARLGDEHERRYLDGLRSAGIEVVEIERGPSANGDRAERLRAQAEATIAVMRAGAPAIYQATFFDGSWLGHADVLRRVEQPSSLGDWSYEVEDTKLARSLKPYFLVQLCFYSSFVERVQGLAPEFAYVVLGDGTRKRFRVAEFAAYERFVRARLEERVFSSDAEGAYPYHVSHCSLCVWDDRCSARRWHDDHLTGVAGLSRLQARRLQSAGIPTLAALGQAQPADKPRNMEARTFERLSRQARLQLEQRIAVQEGELWPYRYELLPLPEEKEGTRGFALLPQPSPGDIFFDMEGDPFYDVADGLEYLFGAYTRDAGFRAFWGCDRGSGPWNDRSAERRAFEAFIDFAMERRAQDPSMHIYHYADYEKRAIKSLAQRHATREDEVDTLLREERLIDLLRVVRQGVVVGQPGYGLKKMEAFYSPPRAGAIVAGDASVLEFERWRASRDAVAKGERADADASILRDIEIYNEQDCKSTSDLLDWLLARRIEAEKGFSAAIPFFTGKPEEKERQPKPDPHEAVKRRLIERLGGDAFDPSTATNADPRWPLWLSLHLLDYHRREEKPQWWAFFDRCDTFKDDPDRLLDDGECIVQLERDGEPVKVKQSLDYPMSFPAQEIKVDGGQAFDPTTHDRTGTAVDIEISGERGRLKLRRGIRGAEIPFPPALIVFNHVSSATLRAALARFADALLSGEIGGKYRAVYDLLLARAPRFRSRPLGAEIQPEVPDATAIGTLIDDLDDSYLFVQGPPGSGKTYQGAHAIVRLLARGLRVGVTANSHKAINNLLEEVERVARERNVPFEGQRKHSDDEDKYRSPFGTNGPIANINNGGFTLGDNGLYAGTAWAFADKAMDGRFDVLFIDEAGQVALPNALAAATAARRVVLLGDPAQLPHVRHTTHPGAMGVSVLEHLLGEELRPVARDRGVLLNRTWRMHPDICKFISNLMYEGQLQSVESCSNQRVDSPGLSGTGIRYIEVDHSDARVRSEDEGRVIADQIELLLMGTITDARGNVRSLEPGDIIVVTPYNAQRRCIETELRLRGGRCNDVRVGTVDKFQGQEAYVVFFSSAKSSHEESVRGVEFIFDRNRLNVAISRARALAVYVGSPAVLRAPATSIGRMRSLSAGCTLVEYGKKTIELSPLMLA